MPLWNRSNPTGAAYQVYTSSTSAAVATAAGVAAGISGACLSCHDGTIAMDVVTNVNGLPFGTAPTGGSVAFTAGPNRKATYTNGTGGTANVMSGGLPFLGSDLRNDHPVAIVYQTALTADPTPLHGDHAGRREDLHQRRRRPAAALRHVDGQRHGRVRELPRRAQQLAQRHQRRLPAPGQHRQPDVQGLPQQVGQGTAAGTVPAAPRPHSP